MQPMLNIAVRAARAAGSFIARSFEQVDQIQTEQKGADDFVTNIDREAERLIIDTIRKAYPDHQFVGEESGASGNGDSDYQWIIDPLDGTTNFVRGIPHFSVSIALQIKGRIEHAVVFDPMRNELFTASRGRGAQLNERRLRTSSARDLRGSLLATGFPFRNRGYLDSYLAIFRNFFEQAGDVRRAGSAALDLAYVAAGRMDGFWELGLKPWDIAAGELLVREAGGLVCDFSGDSNHLSEGHIVAGAPKVVKEMLMRMRPLLPPGFIRS